MKVESREFTSTRYRTLYYLLPFINGVVIEAGYNVLRSISGGSLFDPSMTASMAGVLIGLAYYAAAWLIPGFVICALEIFLIGRIYRRNMFPFVFHGLLPGQRGNKIALHAGPIFLTVAGGFSVIAALRGLSTWLPTNGAVSSTGIILWCVVMYTLTVVPALTHCERAAEERTDDAAEGSCT